MTDQKTPTELPTPRKIVNVGELREIERELHRETFGRLRSSIATRLNDLTRPLQLGMGIVDFAKKNAEKIKAAAIQTQQDLANPGTTVANDNTLEGLEDGILVKPGTVDKFVQEPASVLSLIDSSVFLGPKGFDVYTESAGISPAEKILGLDPLRSRALLREAFIRAKDHTPRLMEGEIVTINADIAGWQQRRDERVNFQARRSVQNSGNTHG